MAELLAAGEELVAFSQQMRRNGVPVSHTQVELAAEALSAAEDEVDAFWALRSALASSPAELRVFDLVWSGGLALRDSSEAGPVLIQTGDQAGNGDDGQGGDDAGSGQRPGVGQGDGQGEEAGEAGEQGAVFSAHERLRSLDFSLYGPAEERLARVALRRLANRLPSRPSRRLDLTAEGQSINFRGTFKVAARTGGFPTRLVWNKTRRLPRRIVFLVDVSGSMQPYAAPVLVLAHALRCLSSKVETFTFGTRLTHLGRASLASISQRAWTEKVSREVPDWAGGTRIGASLHEYSARWGRAGMSRGAWVVICSDGWERGDLGPITDSMRSLSRLAHHVVWLNPLAGRPGYEPLAAGMAAALPYVDDFAAAGDLDDLEHFVGYLAGDRGRQVALPPVGDTERDDRRGQADQAGDDQGEGQP